MLLTAVLALLPLWGSDEAKTKAEIDRMIQGILAPAPVGSSWRLKSPFISVSRKSEKSDSLPEAEPVKEEEPLTLSSVVLGRALVNGKWYKEGDRVRGYVIQHIEPELVFLRRGNTFRPLTVPKAGEENVVIERTEP